MIGIHRGAAQSLGTAPALPAVRRLAAGRGRNAGARSRAAPTASRRSSKSAAPANAAAMIRETRSATASPVSTASARSDFISMIGAEAEFGQHCRSPLPGSAPARRQTADRTRHRHRTGEWLASGSARALPRPSVVRSSRSSWSRTSSPSAVRRTSNSTHRQPSACARRSPASVFSGAQPAAPRCPITGGRSRPGRTE